MARMANMLLHPRTIYRYHGETRKYPDIRLVYWAGGNPFHHHQDLNRLERGWQRPETIGVNESWWTPTARRADIVLPVTTTLERNDVCGSSRDRFVLAMKKALPAQGHSRNDFDIYRELSAMAGHEHDFTEGRDEAQWLRFIYDTMTDSWRRAGIDAVDFDTFWQAGYVELPEPAQDFVLFDAFRNDPRQHALGTPSGKIELYSERIAGFGYDDCPPHPAWLPPVEWLGAERAREFPLHLVTSQPADKLHSQMDAGVVSRRSKIKGRERVTLSRAEGAARGIADGDLVSVFNDRGRCVAAAVLDDAVMDGVAIMSTGAWFDPQSPLLERHGNPNVLTVDVGTSRLTQAPSALSALVQIERWTGPVPDVRAFEAPEFVDES